MNDPVTETGKQCGLEAEIAEVKRCIARQEHLLSQLAGLGGAHVAEMEQLLAEEKARLWRLQTDWPAALSESNREVSRVAGTQPGP